jgi:hypothetical protein
MKLLRSALFAIALGIAPQFALVQSAHGQGLNQTGAPTDLLAPLAPLGGGDLPGPDLGDVLTQPDPFASPDSGVGELAAPEVHVSLNARMTADTPPITNGVSWRIFGTQAGEDGELPLYATATGGTVTLALPKGDYLIHGSYGRAGGTKRLKVTDQALSETLILNAGGLRLDAVVGDDQHIDPDQVAFEISQEDDFGGLTVIMPSAQPNKIIRLSAGTYHIVSRYGFVNAIVRADMEVHAGKLTTATIRHKGAEATFKLVEHEGGEALANTSWTVLTEGGDTLHQSVGAFPTIILAEGTYTAVARHKENTFARDFTIRPAIDRDVEVRLQDLVVQTAEDKS